MREPRSWLQRLRDDDFARWQAGEIDDAAFERRQLAWVRKVILAVSGIGIVVVVGVDWLTHDDWLEKRVELSLIVAAMLAILGVAAAFRFGNLMSFFIHDLVVRRNRAALEATVQAAPRTAAPGPAATPAYGTYQRSVRFARRVLGIASVALLVAALVGVAVRFTPPLVFMMSVLGGIFAWGAFMRLDRRPYLELSASGIWCRAWGAQRHGFGDFKVAYARQEGLQEGIAFVPRRPDELRRKLSWSSRLSFRSGGGYQGHVGTVTLWTTQVDLPRDPLLSWLQAEIARGSELS